MGETAGDNAALVRLKERLREGGDTVSLTEMLRAVKPDVEVLPEDVKPPKLVPIKKKDREALARLDDVYGKVVLTEKRELTTEEVSQLLEERGVVDTILKLLDTRKEAIRDTVMLAMDATFEREAAESERDISTVARNVRGHYVEARRLGDEEHDKEFSRETGSQAPKVTLANLEEAEDKGLISHEDLLSMTTQTRVIDEPKTMSYLSANPHLLEALAEVITPGTPTASLQLRKAK